MLPRESSKNGVSLILTPHFRQIVESVEQNEFVLPKDYITYDRKFHFTENFFFTYLLIFIFKNKDSHNFIPGGSAEYELDSDDERFLKSLNKRWSGELSEELFEEMIDIFEIEAFKRV